jgi:general secretion pathway protein B
MSILLDALRKSEEQRQLGKTPAVHDRDDYRPEASRGSARAWIPLAMSAVAAVLIGFMVWQQFREPAMESVADEQAAGQRRLPQIGASAARPSSAEQTAAPESRTPVESFEQPDPGPGPAVTEEGQEREELARSFNEFQQTGSGQTGADEPAAESPDPQAPEPATPAASEPPPSQAASTPGRQESAPVSYWELPQNVRDGMPELRVSVMVYAENPEDRFLLINGRRMVEKEALQGLVLEEIRRDGAVFRYRNYRFLLKG